MQSDWVRKRIARRERLHKAIATYAADYGLTVAGTCAVYCPKTKRIRTYKSVRALVNDVNRGDYNA